MGEQTAEGRILYLSDADVRRVAPGMARLIELLEFAFREKGEGRVEMPPKPGIHTQPDAFIHAMPAYIPGLRAAGIKWVSGYPGNAERGLPYISGLIILNDVETGLAYAILDCAWVTAYRTAAATGLAARFLAREDSRTAGILACGLQGRTHLEALASLFPLERVYAYDVVPSVTTRYAREMSALLGIEVLAVATPREAVVASDLVVTSGPIRLHPQPTIGADWLAPGSFASAVDFDSYWRPEALAQFDKIATDDHAQFAYYKEVGYFGQTPTPYADLGEIVAGHTTGREHPDERILAVNLGLALDDIAVAPTIYQHALEKGLGTWLS